MNFEAELKRLFELFDASNKVDVRSDKDRAFKQKLDDEAKAIMLKLGSHVLTTISDAAKNLGRIADELEKGNSLNA